MKGTTRMEIENYKRLAAALDALPGTFPSTPSGAELRLLKKSFTEEEAEIGSYMSRRTLAG
jgi:electron transport complex protein RnfB